MTTITVATNAINTMYPKYFMYALLFIWCNYNKYSCSCQVFLQRIYKFVAVVSASKRVALFVAGSKRVALFVAGSKRVALFITATSPLNPHGVCGGGLYGNAVGAESASVLPPIPPAVSLVCLYVSYVPYIFIYIYLLYSIFNLLVKGIKGIYK